MPHEADKNLGFQPGPAGCSRPGEPEPTYPDRLDRMASWYWGFPDDPDLIDVGHVLKARADRARFLGVKTAAEFHDKEEAWKEAELSRIAKVRAELVDDGFLEGLE